MARDVDDAIAADVTPPMRHHFQHIYNHLPETYDAFVSREDWEGNIERTLLDIRRPDGLDVVEIGAGTGRLTALLAERAKSVAAFDESSAMLDIARKRLLKIPHNRWSLSVSDNCRIPLNSASADLVVGGWTLGHLTEWYVGDWEEKLDAVMLELRRLQRPTCTVVLFETMGTCTETPAAPTNALARYYELLETRYGFKKVVIRTDYKFANETEAEQSMRFFFGAALGDKVKAIGSNVVMEWTGVWWRHADRD